MTERTFSIIKPDAVLSGHTGDILQHLEKEGFRIVALNTQLNAYGEQPSQTRSDALLQRDRLNTNIADLEQQRARILDPKSIADEAAASLQPEMKQLQDAMTDRLAARRRELDADASGKIAQFRDQLTKHYDPISPVGNLPTPPKYPHETPLRFPQREETLDHIRHAEEKVEQAAARGRSGVRLQEARLLDLIRSDTKQAVIQVARDNNWKLVPADSPNATDATIVAAAALRAQWSNTTLGATASDERR